MLRKSGALRRSMNMLAQVGKVIEQVVDCRLQERGHRPYTLTVTVIGTHNVIDVWWGQFDNAV
jgi:hypothetical protein